jgi:hypothetical protein
MRVRIGLEQTVYLKDGIKLETDSNGNNKWSFTIRPIKPQPIGWPYTPSLQTPGAAIMHLMVYLQLSVILIQKRLIKSKLDIEYS